MPAWVNKATVLPKCLPIHDGDSKMGQLSADQIIDLCENYRKSAFARPGEASFGRESESFRLLAHNLKFHELNFDELIASIIGLTNTLSIPNLTTISPDHIALWSWCGEFLFGIRSVFYNGENPDIKPLFKTAIRASITAGSRAYNLRELDFSLTLSYVVFPLLEAILKRASVEYMSPDGTVIKPFKKLNPKLEYKVGNRCSNVGEMLHLHYEHVASPVLKMKIDSFRAHIETLDKDRRPFEMIFFWRNDTLHGSASYPTIAGTLFNLCLLITLHEFKDQYEQRRDMIVDRFDWVDTSVFPDAFLYYPPQ